MNKERFVEYLIDYINYEIEENSIELCDLENCNYFLTEAIDAFESTHETIVTFGELR